MSHCYETCRSSLCPYIAQGCLETPTEKQLFAPRIPMSDTILNEPLLMTGTELGEQLSFETLLADVSASFVNLPGDQIDGNIENAERRICECLGLDHASLWQTSPSETGILLLTHLYRDASLPPAPDRMDAGTYFPWCQGILRDKGIVCVPTTAETPQEAATDQQTW